MEQIKLTKRLQRIFSLAENLINNDNRAILYPIHLFIAALQMKTGVLGELNLKFPIDINSLMKISNQLQFDGKEYIHHYFNSKVSNRTIQVLKEAETIMNKYGQIYLNEGHIIKAIFVSDNEVRNFFSYEERELILDITTTPRDLAVSLINYVKPNFKSTSFIVKRATLSDTDELFSFIEKEFNNKWLCNIKSGFCKEIIPIYIAIEENEVIGFGAYDIVKKGLFGPMGIKKAYRNKNVGYTILHSCLNDMNNDGYKYAIIDEAGPIEFYEETCGATIIHK